MARNTAVNPTTSKEILQLFRKKRIPHDPLLIRRAVAFAKEAHDGQTRLSGEPYITHALATAATVIELGLDQTTIIASLLHDVPEDTDITLGEIEETFGTTVAELVEGVTKLKKVRYQGPDRYVENLRKMLLAMSRDVRVILIKLADRKHNLETLQFQKPEKQKRIADESIAIYAAIAGRLGMGAMKMQIEDLAFPYANPAGYAMTVQALKKNYQKRGEELAVMLEKTKQLLAENNITTIGIHSRDKHLYSLFTKLQKNNNDIQRIHDVQAIRIIVGSEKECYEVLRVIHNKWKPMIGRIKDYISQPKPNGYQSLHTTVIGYEGQYVEFQIRTRKMHEVAEFGIAAHWQYKAGGATPRQDDIYQEWIQQLREWHTQSESSKEYVEGVTGDIFKNRIYAYTPKKELIELPEGATALDFAFAIHSKIGLHAHSVRINDIASPLGAELKNGDVVEITTQSAVHPLHSWLDIVITRAAKQAIRKSLISKSDEPMHVIGKRMLDEAREKFDTELPAITEDSIEKATRRFHLDSINAFWEAIGTGDITISEAFGALFETAEIITPRVTMSRTHRASLHQVLPNTLTVRLRMAQCCRPQRDHAIIGVLTAKHDIRVHDTDCSRVNAKHPLPLTWVDDKHPYILTLMITVWDRIGSAKEVVATISGFEANIRSLSTQLIAQEQTDILVHVEVRDVQNALLMIQALQHTSTVLKVRQQPTLEQEIRIVD